MRRLPYLNIIKDIIDKPRIPDNLIAIVPFGCIKLGGYFRLNKSFWKKGKFLGTRLFAHPIQTYGKDIKGCQILSKFKEEILVACLKKDLEEEVYSFIVKEFLD